MVLLFMASYRGKIVNTRSRVEDVSAEKILDRRYAEGEISRGGVSDYPGRHNEDTECLMG